MRKAKTTEKTPFLAPDVINLGSFATLEEAAKIRKMAEQKYFGEYARNA